MIIGGRSQPRFDFNQGNKRLRINTAKVSLIFDQGAVVYLRDNINGKTLLDGKIADNYPYSWIGYTLNDATYRVPKNTDMTFTQIGSTQAAIEFNPCYTSSPVTGSSMVFTFSVEDDEIIVEVTVTEPESSGKYPQNIDLPIINFGKDGYGTAVIAGPRRIAHTDVDDTFYSGPEKIPNIIALEGASYMGVWSEDNRIVDSTINALHHQNNYTHVILRTYADPKIQITTPLEMSTGPWRFSAQSTWLDVAKRWRERFEILNSDAKKLWENASSWVRDIHANYISSHSGSANLHSWNDVRAVVDPTKLLLYLEFSGYQILFGEVGDVGKRMTWAKPWDDEIQYWKDNSLNWNLISYWPFTMYNYNVAYRLTTYGYGVPGTYAINDINHPTGFTPDYDGYSPAKSPTAQMSDWFAWWDSLKAHYTLNGYTQLMHPASDKFQAYVLKNYIDFCKKWNLKGCFWDISGSNKDSSWVTDNPGSRVINGKDYMAGTLDAMKAVYADYPMMAEYFKSALIPYFWFCWVGPRSAWGNSPANHPFWTALLGSYFWSYDNAPGGVYDPKLSALCGGLPVFYLDGDYGADFLAEFSRVRAQLYCTHELYNDLPDVWIDQGSYTTLAYFRSNTGNMFRCEDRGSGRIAFVEEAASDINRLQFERLDGVVCPGTGLTVSFSDIYTETPTVKIRAYMTGASSSSDVVTVADTSGLQVGQTVKILNSVSGSYKRTITEIISSTQFRTNSAFSPALSNASLAVVDETQEIVGLTTSGCTITCKNGGTAVNRNVDWLTFGN